ncbi:hypothetical protein E3N88_34484 [Mikania micrantha]|uniref:No apical meristem-associated C-terminal domain-containing protein n=1 Tax=Mikania micrantha TaxID=192012 RepID=A0A5N6LY98_9ASTR|nr:hypothetical protein E3N88_34484 [Mikania micrantha]
MQQPQFQQTQKDVVESPSKVKATNKKKKPSKKVSENDEQPIKTSRQKWPKSDEVLLAQAMLHISENPITDNNQNGDAYWGKIEKYYNGSQPAIPRDAHNLRSHWHMFKSKLNRFNELCLQVKSRYRSGWSDEQYLNEARQLYVDDPTNKTSADFTYEHVWDVVKDHGKYNSATHVHGFQPPKRTKTSSSGGIDKFYELEKKKVEVKEKKLLYIDTSRMNPYQLAEHDAMCKQIREKYNRDN